VCTNPVTSPQSNEKKIQLAIPMKWLLLLVTCVTCIICGALTCRPVLAYSLLRRPAVNDVLCESFKPTFNKGIGDLAIVYADRDVIVVNKPANLQTAPGYVHKDSLAVRVAEMFSIRRVDRMVAHRLDYATSGLVVFARNDEALGSLHKQFRTRHNIRKVYMAIVDGELRGGGTVNLPIAKDATKGAPYYCIDEAHSRSDAKEAITHWSVVCPVGFHTAVKLIPVTGR
jgi:tRNA pseudouridine32 synthase/23S rRNA pseudouridine746 synthase